jgi:hypothetical protein
MGTGVTSPRSGVTQTNIASWGINSSHITAGKGLLSGAGHSQGIVTNWEETGDYRAGELQNEVGSLIGRHVYDVVRSVSCSHITAFVDNLPAPGTYVTVNGKYYWIKTARIVENNGAYAKLDITLESSTYSSTSGFQQNLVTV